MTAGPDGLEPGPQRPVDALPPLPPGGARRTTTIDTERPDGPSGPGVITARGRDVVVDADGEVHERAAATLVARVGTDGTLHAVERVDGDLPAERLGPLAGQSLRAGMGALIARHLGDQLDARTLVGSLLEDLAGAYFVSGTVLMWADLTDIDPSSLDLVVDMQTDVCAGWRQGASQQVFLVERSALAKPGGPIAPDLASITGAPGRHPVPVLPWHSHRRARLLDLVPDPTPDTGRRRLIAHFRDSVRATGPERVLHEYRIVAGAGPATDLGPAPAIGSDADLDAGGVPGDPTTVTGLAPGGSDVITSVEVDARVLPWSECPDAVASGGRTTGRSLAELPSLARRELIGTSTCTHLNGTIRSLADAIALGTILEDLRRSAG